MKITYGTNNFGLPGFLALIVCFHCVCVFFSFALWHNGIWEYRELKTQLNINIHVHVLIDTLQIIHVSSEMFYFQLNTLKKPPLHFIWSYRECGDWTYGWISWDQADLFDVPFPLLLNYSKKVIYTYDTDRYRSKRERGGSFVWYKRKCHVQFIIYDHMTSTVTWSMSRGSNTESSSMQRALPVSLQN